MARFKVLTRTKIRGIKGGYMFQTGEYFETEDSREIAIMASMSDVYVRRAEISEEEIEAAAAIEVKPDELGEALKNKARRDELMGTNMNDLKRQYPGLWKMPMKKHELVDAIVESEVANSNE